MESDEPDRRRHRPARRWRRGDDDLRHHRQPDWFREALQHRKTVVAYGLIPIAGAQLCYFNAVSHLSVGVALLLEYTARFSSWPGSGEHRRRPSNLTLAGVAIAIAGIMLCWTSSRAPTSTSSASPGLSCGDLRGCYFVMSDEVSADGSEEGSLNSITLAAGRSDRRQRRGGTARVTECCR